MKCRFCETNLIDTFIDLGFAPYSNAYIAKNDKNRSEVYFPLRVKICHECWLVQTEDFVSSENLFTETYAYFSGTSNTWKNHVREYSRKIISEFNLNRTSHVIEIGSNDGTLLENFQLLEIPCTGVEPTARTAKVAEEKGIRVERAFFSENLGMYFANNNLKADLIIGNNVFAHVPNINDFTRGMRAALKPNGIITLEFPHLLNLIERNQFDTIYHEHFSYLSLEIVVNIFKKAGLRVWRVEKLETHGGSLRVYGCHADSLHATERSVADLVNFENSFGLRSIETYRNFQDKAHNIKHDLLSFLLQAKKNNKKVVGYGAAAKGNTLLNFAGVKRDLIHYIFDASPSKQGSLTPGSRIPIVSPKLMKKIKPDYILILPWNIADEIKISIEEQIGSDARLVVAIPSLKIL